MADSSIQLAKEFADYFRADDMERAERLIEHAHLWHPTTRGYKVSAKILDANEYRVLAGIDRDGDTSVHCICDKYGEESTPCAHVYALLLQVDAHSLLDTSPLAESPGLFLLNRAEDFEEFGSPGKRASEDGSPMPSSHSSTLRLDTSPTPAPPAVAPPPPPKWLRDLEKLKQEIVSTSAKIPYTSPDLSYIIIFNEVRNEFDAYGRSLSHAMQSLSRPAPGGFAVLVHRLYRIGSYTSRVPFTWKLSQITSFSDELDRTLLGLLSLCARFTPSAVFDGQEQALTGEITVPAHMAAGVLRPLAESGRASVWRVRDTTPLHWLPDSPWRMLLNIERRGMNYETVPYLYKEGRGGAEIPSFHIALCGDIVVLIETGEASPVTEDVPQGWLKSAAEMRRLCAPLEHGVDLLAEVLSVEGAPPVKTNGELAYNQVRQAPVAKLRLRSPRAGEDSRKVLGEVSFTYEGAEFRASSPESKVFLRGNPPCLIWRDREAEKQLLAALHDAGFRQGPRASGEDTHVINQKKMAAAVATLLSSGWEVEAEGRAYRRPGQVSFSITTGVNWFDVSGSVDFGDGVSVPLPEILRSVRRGERLIKIGGTLGILPEEWLKRYTLLAGMAEQSDEGAFRFRRSQAALLDVLLEGRGEVEADRDFARFRRELRSFRSIKPCDPPPTFRGELRPYQREGLGWLRFLDHFGFGGCLADDMGLGKTPTTLALLESRRVELLGSKTVKAQQSKGRARVVKFPAPTEEVRPRTSIVVAPMSAAGVWQKQAARFTPEMSVALYAGAARPALSELSAYDLVITTYGTLRQDAVELKDFEFDYLILDEAQFVKNPSTQSAKAARLLRARRKLALSGTPVENSLTDLWSIFEIINPGMLGRSATFSRSTSISADGNGLPRTNTDLSWLSKALRPFILRRTKEQPDIAKTLPPKTVEVIYVDLPRSQRKAYDELRVFYRDAIGRRFDEEGDARAKFHTLAALTRLRQAACHTGLVSKRKSHEPCGKFNTLFEMLPQTTTDGHKTLIFSTFKEFLKTLAARLEDLQSPYYLLTGDTPKKERDRLETAFNEAGGPGVFLITLKAGGFSLNLQAADYVFVLDPWWNPKAEAQAIDRAFRIGQERHVFAYRLVARDTIEEKVLELQERKSALADSIITDDNSLISKMTRKDIMALFS